MPGTQSALDRFIFCDKTAGAHLVRFDGARINGVQQSLLQLKADKFSEAMFSAADEWDASVAGDEKIQVEKRKLLVIQSKGFTIGGNLIQFG
jgi:hypothetical protein